MGVKGVKSNRLAQLIKRIDSTRGDALRATVAKGLRGVVMQLTFNGFRKSVDPYGKTWAPLASERLRNKRARKRRKKAKGKRRKRQKPLIDTGRMRASVNGRSEGPIVWVSIPTEYADFHQQQDSKPANIPRRMMLPDKRRGLGNWAPVIAEAAAKIIKRKLTLKSPGAKG